MISCIIPAYNEEKYIGKTLESLLASAKECVDEVEIIVYENGERDGTQAIVASLGCKYYWTAYKSQVLAKNKGAIIAKGDILVFIDADCLVSRNFFPEIAERSKIADGGGVDHVKLTRYSLGTCCFLFIIAMKLLWHRIRVGAFWVRREIFEEMGGFCDPMKTEQIDFAKRLKKYNTSSLEECSILWSTRKFDKYGDWYWLRGYR